MAKKLSTKIEVLGCMTSDYQFTANEIVIYRGSKKVLTLDRHNKDEFEYLLECALRNNIGKAVYYLEDYLGVKAIDLTIDFKDMLSGNEVEKCTNQHVVVETLSGNVFTIQTTHCNSYEVATVCIDLYDIAEFNSLIKALDFIKNETNSGGLIVDIKYYQDGSEWITKYRHDDGTEMIISNK